MTSLRGQRRIRSAVALRPGFVVVEEGVNHRMPGDKGNGFRQVDDRVQNRGVNAQSSGMFQREISEETINPSKAITVSERLSKVVMCLGEEPPLNRSERSSHPPASLRKPTAKKARPFTS